MVEGVVVAGAEAAVDLDCDDKFRLARNPQGINCRKEAFLCQEVMVKVPLVKAGAQVVARAKDRDKVKAGWVDRLPQVRAEIVYAQVAARQSLMFPGNPAIN